MKNKKGSGNFTIPGALPPPLLKKHLLRGGYD